MGRTEREKEYIRRAEEAEAEAEQTRDHTLKQAFLEIARKWREMAAHVERNGW